MKMDDPINQHEAYVRDIRPRVERTFPCMGSTENPNSIVARTAKLTFLPTGIATVVTQLRPYAILIVTIREFSVS